LRTHMPSPRSMGRGAGIPKSVIYALPSRFSNPSTITPLAAFG
jgi:hypothetical protein